MTFFYWLMGLLIVGTFLPSALYLGIYLFTGADEALDRARKMWGFLRLFSLLGFNLMVWGNVVVAAWSLIR